MDHYCSRTRVEPGAWQTEEEINAEEVHPVLRIIIADPRSARAWEAAFRTLAERMEKEWEAQP